MEERSFLQQVVDQTRSEPNASESETDTRSAISKHSSDTLPTLSDDTKDRSEHTEMNDDKRTHVKQKTTVRGRSRETKNNSNVLKDKSKHGQRKYTIKHRQSNAKQSPDIRKTKGTDSKAKCFIRNGSCPKRIEHTNISELNFSAGKAEMVSRTYSNSASGAAQRKSRSSSPLQSGMNSASRQSKNKSTNRITYRAKMVSNNMPKINSNINMGSKITKTDPSKTTIDSNKTMDPNMKTMDVQTGLSPDAVSAANRMLQSVASKLSADKSFASTTTSKQTARSAYSAKKAPIKTEVEIALERERFHGRYKTALRILTKSFYSLERCEQKLYCYIGGVNKDKNKRSRTRQPRQSRVGIQKGRPKQNGKIPKGFEMYFERPKARSASPLPKLLKSGKRSKIPKYQTKAK
ncbi:hypothetical protein DPMN_054626 [Dreissena polymorpha]|uniref:Uncharacterized protein n=1 Tax=Dreissena polymorpha TaxID=45954 RepID=A0A9D4HPX9_DREPO|nr:hypothetical protein DPMN_054626 [Dreissena polymorpha]